MTGSSPIDYYTGRITEYQALIAVLQKRKQRIAWQRTFIVLITLALLYFCRGQSPLLLAGIFLAGVILFFHRVLKDGQLTSQKQQAERLLLLNRQETDLLQQKWAGYYDGNDLKPVAHAYADDLDLFGAASLFQLLNRGGSEQSQRLLAKYLTEPMPVDGIRKIQPAVQELSQHIPWLQEFLAAGIKNPMTLQTEKRLTTWINDPALPFSAPSWMILLICYPLISCSMLALYIADIIPNNYFLLCLAVFLFISSRISSHITGAHEQLTGIAPEIQGLSQQLAQLETASFQSEFLREQQNRIGQSGHSPASRQIRRLNGILKRFDYRYNVYVFYVLNTFFLWDCWQIRALNHWKTSNRAGIPRWFEAIAKMEYLAGLSICSFNHPGWATPVIAPDFFTLEGDAIGHPLIPEAKRVDNSFTLQGIGKIALITGSNMAGKSTFLRSVGINLVLAQAGAVVCAKSFRFSPARLISSMRIADNLAESTSTFYAELKKLKSVIDAVNAHEPVFILLDEMLRGTNSNDRHLGSEAMIRQLIRQDAVAMVATHDISLASPDPALRSGITNYYFDAQVSNDELYFDYRLKPGICQSLNASILMRKIGIDIHP